MKVYLVGYAGYYDGELRISSEVVQMPSNYDLLEDSKNKFQDLHQAGAQQSSAWKAMIEKTSLKHKSAKIISISYLGEEN